MKALFFLLASFLIGSSVYSQAGTVTIKVAGNRITQIAVDDQFYAVNNASTTGEKIITINSLANGQHKLEIVRRSQTYNATTSSINTSFTLRDGYNLTVTISSSGAVSTAEERIRRNSGSGNAISTTAYNRLYTQVKNKTSSSARTSLLENEFSTSNRLFTSKQASSLIQLVNSESMRLKLAKLSYTRITDTENFSLVSSLLNSTSNRNELNNYIATLPVDDDDDDDDDTGSGDANTPMSNAKFLVIYNDVIAESTTAEKNYYLSNFFSKDFNFYSSTQARQLIQLIPTEAERFYLAKVAYRGITDRANYISQVSPLLSNSYNRNELAVYTSTYDSNNGGTGTGTGTAMSTADFDRLYQSAYYQNSTSARYSSISTAFNTAGYYFTVAQAKKLIGLMTDEYSRLQLAKASYKVLTDRYNYTQLNELLSTTASRNEFNNYVANYDNNGSGTGTGTAMSTADFDRLYQSAYYENSTAARYSSINTAFNTAGYYFTVAQAKKLIALVTNEYSRLQLAKASYKVLTDRYNYTQLNELLSTTASRNEFNNYVANYDNNGSGTGTGTAMSSTDFDKIYQSAYYQNSTSARYSSIISAFNTAGSYFSVAQAKKLIGLMTDEYSRLQLAKTSYKVLVDRHNYTQLNELFNTTASRNEFNNYVANYDNNTGTGTGTGVAMSDADYNRIYNNVNSSSNTTTRFNLEADAFKYSSNYFTVYQVRRLLLLISSEADRLSLAKLSYDNVTDQASFNQLYDLFNSTANRNDLANFVATTNSQNAGGIPVYKTPMSESDFTSIRRDIQFTFGLGAKMSSLTRVFNDETKYFSVAQAKELIQLVSSESNRVTLAKLAYNNLADPSNFTQLYDILTSQASKDELNVWVQNNAQVNQ